jgi:hypothetical protein
LASPQLVFEFVLAAQDFTGREVGLKGVFPAPVEVVEVEPLVDDLLYHGL